MFSFNMGKIAGSKFSKKNTYDTKHKKENKDIKDDKKDQYKKHDKEANLSTEYLRELNVSSFQFIWEIFD